MSEENYFNDISMPFSCVFDQLNDGVMLIKQNKIIYCNQKVSNLFQIEKPFPELDFLFPSNLFGELLQLVKCCKTGSNHQYSISNKDLPFNLEIQISGFDFNNQQITSVTFKELAHSESFDEVSYQIFSELIPNIILETSADGTIINYNKQIGNQLFYTLNDIEKGLSIYDILSSGSVPVIKSLIVSYNKFAKSGKIQISLKKKFGEIMHAEMHYQFKIIDGNFEGCILLFVDNSKSKKYENKYTQNQQRLRKVLDLVPHMISLKDADGRILLANKACADFYKTNTKELVYSNISRFHKKEEECQSIKTEDKEVISSNILKEWNNSVLTDNDNIQHIFKTTKIPFHDLENEQTYSLGISVDITQQQKAEIETWEAKEKFRILVERGSEGIAILQDSKIVYANCQAARMFGYQLEEFLGKPLSSLLHGNQMKKTFDEFLHNSQNKDAGKNYEIKILKTDGKFEYVEAKITTINYLNIKSRLIFLHDITKRKMAEKSIERYKNMLEQAHLIANLGSWEWNIQQKEFNCSEEIFNILEVQYDDTIMKDSAWITKFIPYNEKKRIFRGFIHSRQKGNKYDIEFPIVSYTGKSKVIHSQSQMFFDNKGNPERIIGTWLDITERIRLEKVLKEARLKAEESDNLKSAFLSNMSHEIRTPMNAILGFAKLLKSRDIDDKTHLEYIEHILQSGEGLIKLISDIIDISKIESNQLKIEKSPVRINEMLDQIHNRFEEIILIEDHSGIRLNLEKAFPDPEFTILLDPYRLQQVLSYLITNAIKFTPKGIISFGYSIKNSELIFYIKDQGIGIPENKKEMIFISFGKLEGPQRLNKSGTGLGLSISKSLVGLMGGKIWFETIENVGTKFFFSVPLEFTRQKPVPKKEPSLTISKEEIGLGGKTILIAEDEMLNYKLLETLLKKTGANIIWAKNGLEAVNVVSNSKVDLIFMDIKMPEMNGYEATKAIKKLDSSIPIIAQTAFAFANEQQYILQSGCDMYITKPINHLEVYKALNSYFVY